MSWLLPGYFLFAASLDFRRRESKKSFSDWISLSSLYGDCIIQYFICATRTFNRISWLDCFETNNVIACRKKDSLYVGSAKKYISERGMGTFISVCLILPTH